MGRRQTESDLGCYALLALVIMGAISCCMLYLSVSMGLKPSTATFLSVSKLGEVVMSAGEEEEDGSYDGGECCRGIEHLELWGDAVKWGADFKVNSSKECCMTCKGMCGDPNGACLCDSWIFCGDEKACGDKFGECWLNKQKDPWNQTDETQGIWLCGLLDKFLEKERGLLAWKLNMGFFI